MEEKPVKALVKQSQELALQISDLVVAVESVGFQLERLYFLQAGQTGLTGTSSAEEFGPPKWLRRDPSGASED